MQAIPSHAPPMGVTLQHAPFMHSLKPGGQGLLHAPQFWIVSMLVQVPKQQTSLPGQPVVRQLGGVWQLPPAHVSPGAHRRPQPPQSSTLVTSSTQMPPQHDRPPLQLWPPPHDGKHWKFWQMSPAGHWLLLRHTTHVPSAVSQMGLEAGHWESWVHPGEPTQVWLVGLQTSPIGHVSGDVRQPTHTPGGSSQNGVAGVEAQSWFEVHPVWGESGCWPSGRLPSGRLVSDVVDASPMVS
jgi:hypothetical protein